MTETGAKAKTRPERLLAAAMRQGDRLVDQLVKDAAAADAYFRAMRAAVLLIDRGNVQTARRVLQKALNLEDRRGARR